MTLEITYKYKYSAILKKLNAGTIIKSQHEQYNNLLWLAKRHHRLRFVIAQIHAFKVASYLYKGNQHKQFQCSIDNGITYEAFSYKKAIDGVYRTFARFKYKLRHFVLEQTNQAKVELMKRAKIIIDHRQELDHVYPVTFQSLVNDFVRRRKINTNKVIIEDYRLDWCEFHKNRAIVQLLTKKDNTNQPNTQNYCSLSYNDAKKVALIKGVVIGDLLEE